VIQRLVHPIHCLTLLAAGALTLACSSDAGEADEDTPKIVEGTCQIETGAEAPDFLKNVNCTKDFLALASEPVDENLPGARSVKVVVDQAAGNALYFQNSKKYRVHYEFCSAHLSGNGQPLVSQLADFNATEYFSPERRFLLGAVTYYDEPDVWALELAPYDTASAAMIGTLFRAVEAGNFFGPGLVFHPSSEALEREATKLTNGVRVKTTAELYKGISYQPLSLATAIGRLRFMNAAALETEYVPYDAIVVLDEAPNDISVVRGIITEAFQTPLSHINVLSQNRHTPNMGLRGALNNPKLRALDGKWVELTVGASAWSVREATQAEADAYWQTHKPPPLVLPALDLSVTKLVDIQDVTPELTGTSLRESLKKSVPAFGGKAAHYSILAKTSDVPVRKAFGVPVFYYDQFMKQNGLFDRLNALLADSTFKSDSKVRDQKLEELRQAMQQAPVDAAFQQLLKEKLQKDYPGLVMRFRTSTNSEDLEGFPCAGCYESHTGDPQNWQAVLDAIRETWASIWLFRTFEERSYYGVDHKSVSMALLVHQNFPDEEANGVAVTNNIYAPSGLEPAFYINVQWGGDAEVVHPPKGVTSDQILYFFDNPNQPITYLSHSNLVPSGQTVLSNRQIHELGVALSAIHKRFSPAYGPASGNNAWYAMDVEFKFDDVADGAAPPALYVKQARPYPGRGQ
jgi:pyruvate, water dikinase